MSHGYGTTHEHPYLVPVYHNGDHVETRQVDAYDHDEARQIVDDDLADVHRYGHYAGHPEIVVYVYILL